MINDKSLPRLPFFVKAPLILLLVYLIFYIIYIGQGIIMPLGFAFLFAVLLRRVEKALTNQGLPKIVSIMITLVVAILALWLVISFITRQITSFADELPGIQKSLNNLWHQCQLWMKEKLNINYTKQEQMLENAKDQTFNTLSSSGTINMITASVATLMLIPVYIFLFLYYRELFLSFIEDLFRSKDEAKVKEVIQQVKSVVQHFIAGILVETSIVAGLNVAGLLVLGAPYAILLGVLGAIINMIPYIGGAIQLILSALIVYAGTGSLPKMLGTLGVLVAVQFIDNHVLVPRFIGSRVKLNALISIVGVLVGGGLCGIGGMFLSIPFLAICKVIFDRVDDLKPWGKLLGGYEDGPHKRKVVKLAGKAAGSPGSPQR